MGVAARKEPAIPSHESARRNETGEGDDGKGNRNGEIGCSRELQKARAITCGYDINKIPVFGGLCEYDLG